MQPHSITASTPRNNEASDGGWNRATYDALCAAVGVGPVTGIATRFRDDLRTRFPCEGGREEFRRDGHAVASSAGMLGFAALSAAARALEHACMADTDAGASLAQARFEARRAIMRLDASLPA